MTENSEEAWSPILGEGGLQLLTGSIESVFLDESCLDELDADLALRRSRPPIGFSPNGK